MKNLRTNKKKSLIKLYKMLNNLKKLKAQIKANH